LNILLEFAAPNPKLAPSPSKHLKSKIEFHLRDTIAVRERRNGMSKTTTITVRLDPKVKREAQKILEKLGVTTSQAVTMYFNQIRVEKGLPFRPHIPNAETARTVEDALAGHNLHTAKDIDDLFAQLEA
jgi:DNA-damage-inducible protein J